MVGFRCIFGLLLADFVLQINALPEQGKWDELITMVNYLHPYYITRHIYFRKQFSTICCCDWSALFVYVIRAGAISFFQRVCIRRHKFSFKVSKKLFVDTVWFNNNLFLVNCESKSAQELGHQPNVDIRFFILQSVCWDSTDVRQSAQDVSKIFICTILFKIICISEFLDKVIKI